jgi:hypothetical protein
MGDANPKFPGLRPGSKPGPRGPRRSSAERLLAMATPAIFERVIEAALDGDVAAAKVVLEYARGIR